MFGTVIDTIFSGCLLVLFCLLKRGYPTWICSQYVDTKRSIQNCPWLIWYIWKACNEKCFNAKDVSPVDTLHIASREAEAWRIAQIVEEIDAAGPTEEPASQAVELQPPVCKWRCQVDASWKEKEEGAGLGFILLEDNHVKLVGLKKGPLVASPLHAEAESLSWAMRETRKLGICEARFESDCQQLVRHINTPQEWPALGPELDEIDFLCSELSSTSVIFICRSDNGRADCLSRAGRSRASDFCFIGEQAPPWLAH